MYCTAPLSPRKGRLISFHDDDDDDDGNNNNEPLHAAVARVCGSAEKYRSASLST